jgi:molybdenum-dependent DNA-binding transcriptional regulator ModE
MKEDRMEQQGETLPLGEALKGVPLAELCSIQDAAEQLGIHYHSAYNLLHRRLMPWRWATVEEEERIRKGGESDQADLLPRVKEFPPKQPGQRLKLFARADVAQLKRDSTRKVGLRGKDRRPRARRMSKLQSVTGK